MQVALVLRPSVAEKVGVNKKGVNQTRYSHLKPWNRKWLWAVTPMIVCTRAGNVQAGVLVT
jgi:hypothetical protein